MMSATLATACVKIWMDDGRVGDLNRECLDELFTMTFAWPKWRMRVFLAEAARAASDLCWDKRYRSAVKWLRLHPLARVKQKYRQEAIADTRQLDASARIGRTAVNDLYGSHRRSNQWSKCK